MPCAVVVCAKRIASNFSSLSATDRTLLLMSRTCLIPSDSIEGRRAVETVRLRVLFCCKFGWESDTFAILCHAGAVLY